jgi:hypothetical protein
VILNLHREAERDVDDRRSRADRRDEDRAHYTADSDLEPHRSLLLRIFRWLSAGQASYKRTSLGAATR